MPRSTISEVLYAQNYSISHRLFIWRSTHRNKSRSFGENLTEKKPTIEKISEYWEADEKCQFKRKRLEYYVDYASIRGQKNEITSNLLRIFTVVAWSGCCSRRWNAGEAVSQVKLRVRLVGWGWGALVQSRFSHVRKKTDVCEVKITSDRAIWIWMCASASAGAGKRLIFAQYLEDLRCFRDL